MIISIRSRFRRLPFLFFLIILPLLFAFIIGLTTQRMGHGDSGDYLRTAQAWFQFTSAPHGYRILIPYLARLLSILTHSPLEAAFHVLSVLAFEGVNILIIIWARNQLHQSLENACLLAILYSFSFAGVEYLQNYVHIGLWWHLLILIGFWAILLDNYLVLLLVLIVGALVTESICILIPLFFLRAMFRGFIWKGFLRTCGLLAGFLSIFFLLRSGLILQGSAGFSTYSAFYTLDYVKYVYEYMGGAAGACIQILGSYNVVWPLIFLGFWHSDKPSRIMALLIPLAILQIVLATDVVRMVMISFPAMLLMAANLFKILNRPERITGTALAVAAFYAYNWNWHRQVIAMCVSLFILGWYFLVVRRRMRGADLRAGRALDAAPDAGILTNR
jgi:hypothetical protein